MDVEDKRKELTTKHSPMARVHFVQKAAKDNPVAQKGESYFWWKHRFGPKRYSKTQPKRSQLTQSYFLATLYDLQDDWRWDPEGDLAAQVEELQSRIEDMRAEVEESYYNIPDQLREGWSGELLQERMDALDEWHGALDYVDTEVDDGLDDNARAERIDEIIQELEQIEYEGEG